MKRVENIPLIRTKVNKDNYINNCTGKRVPPVLSC